MRSLVVNSRIPRERPNKRTSLGKKSFFISSQLFLRIITADPTLVACLIKHQEELYEKEEELSSLESVVNIGKGVVAGFFSSF